jgi:hypothetical protein
MLFLTKQPSVLSRVLDIRDCPPHFTPHDVSTYPLYYDALYYPQFHSAVYASAHQFCSWLQQSLSSHYTTCARCRHLNPTVTVVFDGTSLCIAMDGHRETFPCSYFESEVYTHCSVFRRFQIGNVRFSATAGCIAKLRQQDDPPWFHYDDASYQHNLQALPAPTLVSIAKSLVVRQSSCRTKKDAIAVVLAHFFAKRQELSLMNGEDLSALLSCVSLPVGCIPSRGTRIAAYFCDVYGDHVATSIRCPPSLTAFIDVERTMAEASTSLQIPWLTSSLVDLSRALRTLKKPDILSSIHQQPESVRALIQTRTLHKACNGLAHAIRNRALQLFAAGAITMGNTITALLPFLDVSLFTDGDIVVRILSAEFGAAVMDCLPAPYCPQKK